MQKCTVEEIVGAVEIANESTLMTRNIIFCTDFMQRTFLHHCDMNFIYGNVNGTHPMQVKHLTFFIFYLFCNCKLFEQKN